MKNIDISSDIEISKNKDGLYCYTKPLKDGWSFGFCVCFQTTPEGMTPMKGKEKAWFTLFDLEFLRFYQEGDPS